MNNWRLLLLAVVAVFQPIASFTDSNLIDGRQQCCDRLSSAPLQDTRSSLHGTYRLGKTTPALRRLNDRDETREDHRYELRQRDSIFSRPSTERPLVDIRGRVARQGPSEIARSSQVQHRLERPKNSPSRERQLNGHQREETDRSIRDLKHQVVSRRLVDRTSRDALERRNDRVYVESSRDSLFRDDYRTVRFGNERLSKKSSDSQREMDREQIRSAERRIALNRDARSVLSLTQDDVSIEASNMNNRQRIVKERMSAVRRESSIRPDTRRYSEHNDERRDQQRSNEERRTLSASTRSVDGIRDMPNRLNAREDNQENRQRIRTNQRLSTERFEERREQREERRESRQQNEDNINRSVSGERRMQVARRITRERDSRIMNVLNTQNERNVDGQREIRQERLSREIQDRIREKPEHRLSRERILMDRSNIRESVNAQNTRDVAIRLEIRQNERLARETRVENGENHELRLSRERIQLDRRNNRESRLMNAQNTRDIVARRESRHNERMETRDENRNNLAQRLSRERIQMDRSDVRESRITNGRITRDAANRRESRDTERMTSETRDENREKLERLSRERIQMERREIRESRLLNAQNTRNVAERRRIRQNDRLARDTREENKENLEQRISRERTVMDRKDVRESRPIHARNTRDVANRREIRHNERMTRETRDENRDNLEQRISREMIQMERRDLYESRLINARNTRDIANRRESQTERMTRDENRENLEQRVARERLQIERRDTRDSHNTKTVRSVADRREMRHSERNTPDERANHINRFAVERSTVDRRNVREFRVINNLISRDDDRRINSKRESRFDNRMSREIQDKNRASGEERLSREKIQADRLNIREFRAVNTPNEKDIGGRQEVRYTARSTEIRKEARLNLNPEQRISRQRTQMDRRNSREFRSMNIVIRTDRAVDSQREIRNEVRLLTEHRENPDNRLVRERIQTDRRYTRESRMGNNLNRVHDSRQERESRETREEMREKPDRGLAREIRQVVRRNTRESRINRVATHERSFETDPDSRREIRNNERLSGQIRSDRANRERRLESRSSDRVDVERDISIMDRRSRSADRRNFREIRAVPRLSRSADSERRLEVFRSRVEQSHNIENREREAIDARSRNVEMARNRERNSVMVGKMETESDFTVANWRYVLYTLQAAYLCALFMQMLTPSRTEKVHKMSLRWLPAFSHYNPIKVD